VAVGNVFTKEQMQGFANLISPMIKELSPEKG
jgi:hypothetical protein